MASTWTRTNTPYRGCGVRKPDRSCGHAVFVDQPAEPIAAAHTLIDVRVGKVERRSLLPRRCEAERGAGGGRCSGRSKCGAYVSSWRLPAIRSQSRHSTRTVRIKRSATAFAFGARNGVRMICSPAVRNISSKPRVNLPSRSWIRMRSGVRRSWRTRRDCELAGPAIRRWGWRCSRRGGRRLPSSIKKSTYSLPAKACRP
jgi:hypothetical protein